MKNIDCQARDSGSIDSLLLAIFCNESVDLFDRFLLKMADGSIAWS
jgi:hypothetical protein